MNPPADQFYSKLLLFGEYGLMYDAMALSIPFYRFYGYLDIDSHQINQYSNNEIRKFSHYLADISDQLQYPFTPESIKVDIDKGLHFKSTIPLQYGLGSSGALIAALFKRFTALFPEKDVWVLNHLKEDFALLESHFHGRSSGLDPLVSFINQPVLLHQDKSLETISLDLHQQSWSFALIDTKATGATGPLVQLFMERMKDQDYKTAFQKEYLPASNGCIQSLLNGDQAFFTFLNQLIHYELQHFDQMIPTGYDFLIKDAINQNVYIKLLGSGGGGFLLAIAPSAETMDQWAESKAIVLKKIND